MKCGNLIGLIDGLYQVVHDESVNVSEGVTQIQVTGLSGNIDNHYKVIGRIIGNNTADYVLRCNDDSSAVYGYQEFKLDTSYSGQRYESTTGVLLANNADGEAAFFEADIYAHSGHERTVLAQSISGVTGTTIGSGRNIAGVYNETSNEITSISVNSSTAFGLGLDSRILILKKVELQDGTSIGSLESPVSIGGVWSLVSREVLTEIRNPYDFINLDGDTDVIYKLVLQLKNNAEDPMYYSLTLGPGTGNKNTIDFYSYNRSGVHELHRVVSTGTVGMLSRDAYGDNWSTVEALIYAASGASRMAITKYVHGIHDSAAIAYGVGFSVGVWDNTVNNITTMSIAGSGGNYLEVGTIIELWKLNIG